MENMKQILKRQGEDPKFVNRRKQEYLDLVKKPVFSETLIRVKLHDNWVFECRFAPLETLEALTSIFHEVPLPQCRRWPTATSPTTST